MLNIDINNFFFQLFEFQKVYIFLVTHIFKLLLIFTNSKDI